MDKEERIAHNTLGAFLSVAFLAKIYNWDRERIIEQLKKIEKEYNDQK